MFYFYFVPVTFSELAHTQAEQGSAKESEALVFVDHIRFGMWIGRWLIR